MLSGAASRREKRPYNYMIQFHPLAYSHIAHAFRDGLFFDAKREIYIGSR